MHQNLFHHKGLNLKDKEKAIKDAIFAFSGGQKSVLIKGEGREISTAVEIAEILRQRLFPSIEISDITLGSRPFFKKSGRDFRNNRYNKEIKNDIVSQIEIQISRIEI